MKDPKIKQMVVSVAENWRQLVTAEEAKILAKGAEAFLTKEWLATLESVKDRASLQKRELGSELTLPSDWATSLIKKSKLLMSFENRHVKLEHSMFDNPLGKKLKARVLAGLTVSDGELVDLVIVSALLGVTQAIDKGSISKDYRATDLLKLMDTNRSTPLKPEFNPEEVGKLKERSEGSLGFMPSVECVAMNYYWEYLISKTAEHTLTGEQFKSIFIWQTCVNKFQDSLALHVLPHIPSMPVKDLLEASYGDKEHMLHFRKECINQLPYLLSGTEGHSNSKGDLQIASYLLGESYPHELNPLEGVFSQNRIGDKLYTLLENFNACGQLSLAQTSPVKKFDPTLGAIWGTYARREIINAFSSVLIYCKPDIVLEQFHSSPMDL